MPRKRQPHAPSAHLAGNVQRLREDRDWSQARLAHEVGNNTHITSISRIENGKTIPSLDVVVRLAQVFATSVDALIHDKSPTDQTPNEKEKAGLHALVDQLSPEFHRDAEWILTSLAFGRHVVDAKFGEPQRLPPIVTIPNEKPEDGT